MLTRFLGPTLEEIAMLFDGDHAAVGNEETIAGDVREKSMTTEKTSQVEQVNA